MLRGSKDGFVETIVFNTALIRRRIRSTQLRMEMLQAGKTSHTDIVLCYMEDRVDQQFLEKIRNRIQNLQVDALTLNQESLRSACIRDVGGIRFRSSDFLNVRTPRRHRCWREISSFWWTTRRRR